MPLLLGPNTAVEPISYLYKHVWQARVGPVLTYRVFFFTCALYTYLYVAKNMKLCTLIKK